MAVKLGIWSLTLLPGETYPMHIRKDFQITNASLGEDLKDNNGRSVVKVTHEPLPSAFFDDSDSEDDEEYDSEIDGDLPTDEFKLDSEEGFKKVRKAVVNGGAKIAAGDDEDDEEEDDDFEGAEDDSEDDEDMSDDDDEDDELMETTVLCALTAGKIEQANLNITFTEGDVAMFEVTGDNAVHLMGNYLEQFPSRYDNDSEDDSEFDSDEQDDYSDLELEDLEDIEDDDVPVKGRITEISDVPAKKAAAVVEAKVKAGVKPVAPVADKKRKADAAETSAADISMTSADGLSKNQKKKLAKKAKTEPEAAAAAPKKEAAPAAKAGKKVLPNGLEIEDIKVGNGPVAKPGKKLQMRYIGKLNNGKQFDANTAGSPFTFTLGRGEVIKGWDQGLAGMAVGGERKLVIPAPLAYGKQKMPGLPANSTLNFEVKLLAVK